MSKSSCFIIMPLTTPKLYVEQYKGDTDHFVHVLDHLFKPAIKEAGMDPIPPISKGSEVIHGDIIRNLETADLVLCDMSILNPNVFFELGIRTALNKSVAMIRDNVTARVPFDTTIINYHEYDCGLEPWKLDEEIKKLTGHLTDCMENGSGNSLWGYFSMTQEAEVPTDAPDVDKQLNYLNRQIEVLREQLNTERLDDTETRTGESCSLESIMPGITEQLWANNIDYKSIAYRNRGRFLWVESGEPFTVGARHIIQKNANRRGYTVNFVDAIPNELLNSQ